MKDAIVVKTCETCQGDGILPVCESGNQDPIGEEICWVCEGRGYPIVCDMEGN